MVEISYFWRKFKLDIMNKEFEERLFQSEKNGSKLDVIISELKKLNSTNLAILERLVYIQNGDINSLQDICNNIFNLRGEDDKEDCCTLMDLKEAIENNLKKENVKD